MAKLTRDEFIRALKEMTILEIKELVDAIQKVKPTTEKGTNIKNITVSSTMGPGVKLDLNSFDK